MTTIERRPLLALLLGTALIPLLGAAGGHAAEPVRGGTLVAVVHPEPTVLTSTVNNHFTVNSVSPNVYDGLLTYDAAMTPLPSLAERWEVSPDHLSITFHLRPNVTLPDHKKSCLVWPAAVRNSLPSSNSVICRFASDDLAVIV